MHFADVEMSGVLCTFSIVIPTLFCSGQKRMKEQLHGSQFGRASKDAFNLPVRAVLLNAL